MESGFGRSPQPEDGAPHAGGQGIATPLGGRQRRVIRPLDCQTASPAGGSSVCNPKARADPSCASTLKGDPTRTSACWVAIRPYPMAAAAFFLRTDLLCV